MDRKNLKKISPSEFYRVRRPEYFSDSEIAYEAKLPKEHLSYELQQISTNQKHDVFEVLCRKLAEIFISPNLIPQVGPTGGGDGKTDSETYPVSSTISDRWYVPENGWSNNEKWGFAFSAKEEWKSKAKIDIRNIVGTERGYTHVYFITNQTPSSKKKKDAQDEFKKDFSVEVIILDREWILEKVYSNNLIDLVADSLNLSEVYKNKKINLGPNDTFRIKKLEELERKISNPNRYFEYDFQLVDDAIESAILSRMLERPRDEVEGKFDRALRFCRKVNNNKQWLKLHYQKAWTYLNWYNDFPSFVDEYKNFKTHISETPSISDIELYFNLINLLRGYCASGDCDLSIFQLNIIQEKDTLYEILDVCIRNEQKPCSSLIAKSYKSILGLIDSLPEQDDTDQYLKELSSHVSKSSKYMDYPFESFKNIIEELGDIFLMLPTNRRHV